MGFLQGGGGLQPCVVPSVPPLPGLGGSAMNKLRQSLRRKKPAYVPEAARPHQWQADEEAVRHGKCSFPVRVSGSRDNHHHPPQCQDVVVGGGLG